MRQHVAPFWDLTTTCASPATLPSPVPSQSDARPSLPPLRDWKPTLLRAYEDLLQWSRQIHILSEGVDSTSDHGALLDDLFHDMVDVLHQHAPSQRRIRRQRQPPWWTSECFAACVARNGAWRDCRPELHARFRAARTSFHRVVRSCQTSFWSQWQDDIAALSRSNPRAAATRVRHTFRQGHARRDQTHRVHWPELVSREPSQQEVLAQWRQHFFTAGAQSASSFDEAFHELTVNRFAELCELPCHRPLPMCRVCRRGRWVALFPFQGDVSMVASSSVVSVQPCILVGHSAFVVEAQHCGAHVQAW